MPLLDNPFPSQRIKTWQDEIPLYYVYTLGVAGERFFREIKENARIMGSRCRQCQLTYVPPKMYCERCFEDLKEWLEVGTKGQIHTFTIAHIGLDGIALKEPQILALIALDGAHGGLVHRIGGIDPSEVQIGMEVEAVFKARNRRKGSILDIRHFRPLKR